MLRKRGVTVVAVCTIVFALVVFFSSYGQAAKQKIRIGYLVADQLHQYILPIGIEKGYFAEEGLEVTKTEYASAGILMQGFSANDMDIGLVGVSGAMISKASGADVVVVGSQNWGGSALVVDPGVHSFEELKNQPVGTPGIGSNHHTLLTLLEKKFNTPVNKLSIRPPDMPVFAQNKEVKAIIAYEPFPTRVMKTAGFKRLFTSNQILQDQQCCVLVAHSKFINEHRDVMHKIARVNARATKFIRENKEEALKIIEKYSGIQADILREAYDNMIYPWPPRVNSQTSKILLQGLLDAQKVSEQALKPNVDAWWDKLYDTSFEEELVKTGYLKSLEKGGKK